MTLTFALLGAAGIASFAWAMWQSLRAAFGAVDPLAAHVMTGSIERAQLLHEKQAIVGSIADLKFDRDAGKMSDQDFAEVESTLRLRARDVLQRLDESVEPFVGKAEKLIERHLAKVAKASQASQASKASQASQASKASEASKARADAALEEASRAEGAAKKSSDRAACPNCDTTNDRDAKFCKECAHALMDGPGHATAAEEQP